MQPEIHPLAYVGVFVAMCAIIGGMLWFMVWNARRIERKQGQQAVAPNGPALTINAPLRAIGRQQPTPPVPHCAAPEPLPLIQWLRIIQHQPDEHPHLILYARSGAGKTTLVKAIMASRQGRFFYLSPKVGEFGVAYPTVEVVNGEASYAPIETALQQVLREVGRRLTLGVQHQHEQLTIVLDDYATLKVHCPSAAKVLFQVGTIGRQLRMRLIICTTTKRVKGMGLDGLGDALDNFVEIELPKETRFVNGLLSLDSRDPLPIDLADVEPLSRQELAAARWWQPPVSVSPVEGTQSDANTPNTPPIHEAVQVGDTRQAVIRKAAAVGLTRKEIALIIGGNYNEAYAVVKQTLDTPPPKIGDTTTQQLAKSA
jgi:hypothetical protein